MKILIIKPSSFGDIVQAAPCAAALKKVYPGCKVSWVVFKQWAGLVEMFPDIDNVVVWDRNNGLTGFFRVLKEIRKTEFDIAIDLQGLLRSAFLTRFAKAKIKIGVPGMKEGSAFLLKEPYPQNAAMNATLRNLEPLRFLTGTTFLPEINIKIDEDSRTYAQNLLKENNIKEDFIALLPFARGKGKDWGASNYENFIRLINEKYQNFQTVILGSASDYGKIKSGKTVDLCGKTNLKQLAAVLSKSIMTVGADTGPMHLASALNVPSVFIFGKSDINETAPYLGRFSLLLNKQNPNEINKITPEEVLEASEKWIK